MAELGKFFVTVGSKFDKKGLDKARASINQLGRVVAIFGAAYAGAMAFAIKKAIDLEETTAKFNTVFRGVTKEATIMADRLVKSYGVSTEESRRFLSGMQDLLVPMGMTRKAAAEMSDEVVRLSVDIGSFNNMPTEQVMRDIQSAFNGMPLPMRKYGVNITQNRIQQEALNLGLVKTGEELTIIAKAQAVFSLIQADSSDAQGDFARTSAGLANQLKIVKAKIDDLIVGIGEKFVPTAKDFVTIIGEDILPKIEKWIDESGNIEKIVIKTANAIRFATRTAFAFAKTIGFIIDSVKIASDVFTSWGARINQVRFALKGSFTTAKLFGKIAELHSNRAKKSFDKLTDSVIKAGITIDEMNKLELESFKLKEEEKTIIKDEVNLADEERAATAAEAEIARIERLKALRTEVSEFLKKETAEREEAIRIEDRRTTNAIARGIKMVADLEILTWRTGVKAFGEAMKQRLAQYIMTKHVELVAAKTVALAKAIFNSATTFGAASYQIGVILGQFAVAIGALRAIGSFEKGGIVPGMIGQPQLAVVHGGETITPPGSFGNITINVNQVHSRREAQAQAKIIGDIFLNKVRKSRRI